MNKYSHLTKNNKGQYTLPINVPAELASGVSADVAYLVKHAPSEIRGMAGTMRWWIGQFKTMMDVQARNDHALDILDSELFNNERINHACMALLGCATTTHKEFTGVKSAEYDKRYGDE